ncbi:hypothetical protein BDP27DRAFT_1314243 [Rhodocollybia butyracea]|uniref:Uncharacterized protein n=1 Tax=Rhodocollybia butyracea TaxID=206335 RepID=A0A9P5Q8Q6_9AGAR|nr:hypothetical protein BDP27DRAFT_1314243 [Rhodocollybia butyracea]
MPDSVLPFDEMFNTLPIDYGPILGLVKFGFDFIWPLSGVVISMGSAFETNNPILHPTTMFCRLFAVFFVFTWFGASIGASIPSATSVEISKRQAPGEGEF